MNTRFALVDCNNFYASCERVFNPRLIGNPVVVMTFREKKRLEKVPVNLGKHPVSGKT